MDEQGRTGGSGEPRLSRRIIQNKLAELTQKATALEVIIAVCWERQGTVLLLHRANYHHTLKK